MLASADIMVQQSFDREYHGAMTLETSLMPMAQDYCFT
eukprot:SAG11_NODE_21041_length_433_cov_0.907186_1_plen_37_part_10